VDSEDSISIKAFLSVWWSDGKQRLLMAATGGRGWWKRRVEDLGEGLERERDENWNFHVKETPLLVLSVA